MYLVHPYAFLLGKCGLNPFLTFIPRDSQIVRKKFHLYFKHRQISSFSLKIEMIYVCLVSLGLIFLEINKIQSIFNLKVGEKHQYHQVPQNFWSCDLDAIMHKYVCYGYI